MPSPKLRRTAPAAAGIRDIDTAQVGDAVVHRAYGRGEVRRLRLSASTGIVATCRFKAGDRDVLLTFARDLQFAVPACS